MSQEISKRLGSVGYNPNIPHLYVSYNLLIAAIDPNFLPGTSKWRDVEIVDVNFQVRF